MRKFLVLLGKELRELLTLQMLAPFLVTILVFAGIGNLVGQQGERSEDEQAVGVVDLDVSGSSQALVDAIAKAGFRVVALGKGAESTMAAALPAEGLTVGLVVPAGFEQGLHAGEQQDVQTYAVLESFSFLATRDAEQLSAVLAAVNDALSTQMIAAASPASDAEALKSPVRPVSHVIVGEKESTTSAAEVMLFVSSQTTFIPIILFIVIIFAAQMIATTIANEKENKTLETLLAAPVSRTGLVGAKMVAASTVAMLSAGAYMLGMWYYMKNMSEGFGGAMPGSASDMTNSAMSALGITLGTVDYVLLGLILFFSILAALAIAVILGAFAESVRAVQSLLAPLMVMLMVPYFLTLFVDIAQLSMPLRIFVYAIPFSHAFLAAPSLFLGDIGAVLGGIAYLVLWCAALVIVAGRIFATDRILTMKLDLRRKHPG